MAKYQLDFNLLPDLTYSTWIYNLGDEIEQGLKTLPETLERAHTAMRCVYVLSCGENYSHTKQANFRGALSETVCMEEALGRDLKRIGSTRKVLKCKNTKDPVLHIVKSLRNLETHIQSSKLTSAQMTYWLGPKDKPEELIEMQTQTWYTNDLTLDIFNDLDDIKRYEPQDVISLLNWFNEAQKLWGVYEIIRLGILRYSTVIIDEYGLGTK